MNLFGDDPKAKPPDDAPHLLAFGGGVNSTALLCGWIERGLRPIDAVLFADTGGERDETYRYVEAVSAWLVARQYPAIVTVRKVDASGAVETLEQNCLDHQTLPSLAYGFKKCSHKFKHQPQDKWTNSWSAARDVWDRGERVVKLIGFDADEPHRANRVPDQTDKYWYRYPLIEWGWGRLECIQAITRAGLEVPAKSACFFCPANTEAEIKVLKRDHPDLLTRALDIEANAANTIRTVKGLGRRFSWRDLILGKPLPLFSEPEIPCDCYDGTEDAA